MVLVDEFLAKLAIKVWTFTGDYPNGLTTVVQEARDVALASDGSYYIAGIVSGGFDFSAS